MPDKKCFKRSHLRIFGFYDSKNSYVRVIRKRTKGSYFAKMILIAK